MRLYSGNIQDKGVLSGYKGEEKYIDLNVFRGSEEALGAMVLN